MKKELDQKLCNDHPEIFQDRWASMRKTAMCWGFPGDGWYDLIDDLCKKIDLLSKTFNLNVKATQVKEKFGTLRFYISGVGFNEEGEKEHELLDDIIYDLIDHAEHRSAIVCEQCGSFGKTYNEGWMITLCLKCKEKRDEERSKNL